MAQLLAIVEVSEQQKVRCRADGCGRGVWRRIHVVEVNGSVTVLGSDCFEQLYGSAGGGNDEPLYAGSCWGMTLTEEMRNLMEANTVAFTELMRDLYAADLEAAMQRAEREAGAEAEMIKATKARHAQLMADQAAWQVERDLQAQKADQRALLNEAVKVFDKPRRLVIESEVRNEFRRVHGIDVSQPGWAGWFRSEVRRWIVEELLSGGRVEWPGLILFDAEGRTRFSKVAERSPAEPKRKGDGPDWAAMAKRQPAHEALEEQREPSMAQSVEQEGLGVNAERGQGTLWGE